MTNLIVDPVNNTDSHYIFNKTICDALENLGQKNKYILSNNQFLNKGIDGKLLGNNKYSLFVFILIVYSQTFMQLLKDRNIKRLIFLAIDNTFFIIAVKIIKLIYGGQILVISHNNLQSINGRCKKEEKWFGIDKKYNIKFIVLSTFLKQKMQDILDIQNIIVLKHPTFNDIYNTYDLVDLKLYDNRKYDFIFLGGAAYEARDTGFLKHFLKIVDKENTTDKIDIALPYNNKEIKLKNIKITNYGKRPDFQDYSDLIGDSKFVVICSSRGGRLTASGVLADALSHGTAILAPDLPPWNEHVPYSLNKFLYNNNTELAKIINRLFSLTSEEKYELLKGIHSYSMSYCCKEFSNKIQMILK